MTVIKSARLRKILKIIIPFILMPTAVLLGMFIFDDKLYAYISFTVTILSLILFIAGFEKKQTGTRRLVIVAVMVALSVAGRFIPFFKPVTALTILTAVYFGGEAGFLTGALSAVISNFYFGQGPWTPFQMLAWGMTGLIAGLLSKPLKKNRVLLIVYGVLSGVIFSFIMDVWTVSWYTGNADITAYAAALITALPHTALYAVSNVVFLLLFAKPFGEKFERIAIKYDV